MVGRKLTEEQAQVWFDRVKYIPDQAWADIVERLLDSIKVMPTPDQVKELWNVWQSDHPKSIVRHRYPCDVCDGNGYIEVDVIPKFVREKAMTRKMDMDSLWEKPKAVYHSTVSCGHCQNISGPSDRRRMTLEEIEGQPFMKLRRSDVVLKTRKQLEKNVNALADAALKDMNVMFEEDDIPF